MTFLWSLLINNRIARFIGGALVAILGVLTFGAIKKREGAQAAKSAQQAKDAKAYVDTRKKIDAVDRASSGDDARAKLRDRNSRKP